MDMSDIENCRHMNVLKSHLNQINSNINQMNIFLNALKAYDEIDKLAQMGIPVIIASGNNTDKFTSQNSVNMLTLNQKPLTVRVTDPPADRTNSKEPFSYMLILWFM